MEKQRETYRRMLEQLLIVEQAHRQTLHRLENEKRNHNDFMRKSDEFTSLLEQERERSVRTAVNGEVIIVSVRRVFLLVFVVLSQGPVS